MRIVIVGAGEVGFHIARRLALESKDVVVIDRDPEALSRVSESLDVQVVNGSGCSPLVLAEAGVEGAEILLAVMNNDESNLVSCLVADSLSPSMKKLARIRDADYDTYHGVFRDRAPHIDTIVNPEIEVVKTIVRLMTMPGAVDVGEFADGRVKFVGVYLDESSRLAGLRLSELSAKIGKQCPLIAAVVRDEELTIPRGQDKLMPNDLVYFISEESNLHDALAVFGKHPEPLHRVLIVGGGRIGLRLALHLEKMSIQVKIIEKDHDRCVELAERLNKALVLDGDGSDQGLLNEENIRDMDIVVTLTGDEETNILASLLAKRIGARRTITRMNKFSYFPLMTMIGLELAVSPRLSVINSILQHTRRGKVLSMMSIKGEQAEVMEAVALKSSSLVNKPLKDISFPQGVLITGIIHEGEVTIPSGNSIIRPDDRIIVFARRQAVAKIEKILAVELKYF
ncbi:Trk system potassium transporter TrkA [bacterium]|nr:Trk system potassium transporter TrkA [bacterium]